MTFYVYTYIIDGVPRYVGKGVGDRWKKHRQPSKKSKLANTLRHRHKILGEWIEPIIQNFESENLALAEEVSLIKRYGREDLGTGTLWNLTDGGEGTSGHIVAQATRDKIRKTFALPEVKAKHSFATSQGIGPKKIKEKTKRGSEEFRKLVALRTKEAMNHPNVREKLLGREFTIEHRQNLSFSHLRLSQDQIVQIYQASGTYAQVAERFGISKSHVGCIKRLERQIYKNVIGEFYGVEIFR